MGNHGLCHCDNLHNANLMAGRHDRRYDSLEVVCRLCGGSLSHRNAMRLQSGYKRTGGNQLTREDNTTREVITLDGFNSTIEVTSKHQQGTD